MEVRFVVYVNPACPLVYLPGKCRTMNMPKTTECMMSIPALDPDHRTDIHVECIVSGSRILRWTPYARIHTTLCGEWTQGGDECPGGYWLGPFGYEEAVHAANATGLLVVRCNLLLKFLKGEVKNKKPGYKAQDLHLLVVEECRFRTILRYPLGLDIILEHPTIIGERAYHLGDICNCLTVDWTQ